MLLTPSPEQEQLADAVRRTLRDAGGPSAARRAEAADDYDNELWRRLNALGVGALAGARDGELGSLEDVGMVAFEVGHVAAPVPYLEASVLPARLLLATPDGTLKNELLERLAAGDLLPVAVAASESHGRCLLRAGRLQGASRLVRSKPAGQLLQLATNEQGDYVLCLVDLESARTMRRSTIGRSPVIDVYYDNTKIVDAITVSQPYRALNEVHAVTAAWWAGASRALVDMTTAYAHERRQFDRPIGAFQAIQHRLADMAVDAESSQLISRRACALGATGQLTERDALEAWSVAGGAAQRCAAGAHQVFGGYGFTVEFDVQLFSRRVRALQFWLTDPLSVERRLASILRSDAGVQPSADERVAELDGSRSQAIIE